MSRCSKKHFTKEEPTNIFITGAAQGLGKLLAMKFGEMSIVGAVNLIVCDIREDLAEKLIEDVTLASGVKKFPHVFFYKANLASSEEIESLWAKIIKRHGTIHMLINNAAICVGKRVDEMTIQQVKLTMDINFHSYVHLIMLF
jgi:all-trans-retinol dehydrogenase (NAD+)